MITDENGSRRPEQDVSLIRALNVLLRHRRLIVLLPAVLVLTAAAFRLTRPVEYTSRASFIPQRSGTNAQGFGGLAAQLGISVRPGTPAESPSFYAELIRSRAILEPALQTPLPAADGQASVRLRTLYERRDGRRLDDQSALERVNGNLAVGTSRTTDLVHVAASDRSPRIAQALLESVLQAVNRFNLQSRQSMASEERRFVEGRLDEARRELRSAEAQLAGFLQRNAQFTRAPLLLLEHERLQREVAWRQQVFTSLAESYEQARIEEVRSNPVITVVEPPSVPSRPDGRGTVRWALLAGILGVLIAVPYAFLREYFSASRTADGDDVREFTRLRRETTLDLRRPWRVLALPRSRAGESD